MTICNVRLGCVTSIPIVTTFHLCIFIYVLISLKLFKGKVKQNALVFCQQRYLISQNLFSNLEKFSVQTVNHISIVLCNLPYAAPNTLFLVLFRSMSLLLYLLPLIELAVKENASNTASRMETDVSHF